jgi:hypothetical protein
MRKMEILISDGAPYKIIKVVCYLHFKRQKLKPCSFLMFVRRTNSTEDEIVLRYEKIEVPLPPFLRTMPQKFNMLHQCCEPVIREPVLF